MRKLGIQPDERIVAINATARYAQLLEGRPDSVSISSRVVAGLKLMIRRENRASERK